MENRRDETMAEGLQIFPESEVPFEESPMGRGVKLRWVISKANGAPRYAMRVFEVQPDGEIPLHNHWYEQEMYILEGEGMAGDADSEQPIGPGTVIYVPPDHPHRMRNTGKGVLRFICVIPHQP